nr:unnamed protein product [Callosobruchus analis]
MVDSGCVKKDGTIMQFQQFPYHTQAVERRVKLVMISAVCGEVSRDGFIRARVTKNGKLYQHLMPKHNTQLKNFGSFGAVVRRKCEFCEEKNLVTPKSRSNHFIHLKV